MRQWPTTLALNHVADVPQSPTSTMDIKFIPRTPTERQIALRAALEIDPGIQRFSWTAIQMYLVTLVVCCCSGDSGFDGTVMGGINSMKQFQRYFGLTGVGSQTRYFPSLFCPFMVLKLKIVTTAYFPDKYGRRFSMFFGNAVLIVGAVLTANSTSKRMFLLGRFLTGLGSSCSGASAKSYLAEIVPAHSRGAYMGFLNSFFYVGQMSATGLMVATGRIKSDLSWRLPLYVQAVPAAINVAFIFFCPESPRWLYSIGKALRAREIIAKFHSRTNDINSPLVDLEMREIDEKIQTDGINTRWWDFRPLFKTRADRYRAYMVILIGQLSGNGLITYFLPILLKNAGVVSQDRQLTLNFLNSITSYAIWVQLIFLSFLQGSVTVDRYGRRKILLLATSLMIIVLTAVTGLANLGIIFIYLFMVVYSFGWTPMQALYPTEVLSYEARAKGLAFLGIVLHGASLINTFGLPVALQNLGWKVYLIFLVWDVFELIIIYLFVVETKGLSLEEINEVFEDPDPRTYSERLLVETQEARKGQRVRAREGTDTRGGA
ncbi:general substrate transporter [Gymnopilus junonius]|uniref:General substrate transporter n=1 Tax=Gymnopilus junonius TaxID=109634 RepID=A0A9P5TK96_GYMJU|nr:general substrate transporter [Gymnopilus junonius]